MKKTHWLDRYVGQAGPYLTLCLTQAEFDAAMRHLKVPEPGGTYVVGGAAATTTFVTDVGGRHSAVVCLRHFKNQTPVEVAALLVHEAVHIWQRYLEMLGEKAPGDELEAYGIQAISQTLMLEYARRIKNGYVREVSRGRKGAGDGGGNDGRRKKEAHAPKGLAKPRRKAAHRALAR